MKHLKSTLLTLCLLCWGVVFVASAHGTKVTTRVEGNQFIIDALYDSGEPMADAQILVYAPNDPQKVWLKDSADEQGHFAFDLDPTIQGSWSVAIRTAGHGQIIYVEVDQNGVQIVQRQERSSQDKLLLAGAIVAILGAIAYVFWRKKG